MSVSNDDRRDECVQAALDCRTCIQASASSIARLSPDLSRTVLEQLFLQMYPHEACASNCDVFVRAYRQSGTSVNHAFISIATAVACA